MTDDPQSPASGSHLPLKPVWFQILLTLAEGARHGYAIRREVEERTDGKVRLWPTTLYGALGQLEEAQLIVEAAQADATDDDVNRRFYQMTALGHDVLAAEADRLAELVHMARTRQAVTRPRTA